MSDLEARITAIEDRQEIFDCIMRYCRGLDRMDEAMCKSAYHDDAVDDHAVFIGSGHGLVDWANEGHPIALASWQHNITNISIELDGDTAHTESYYFLAARKKDSFDIWLGGGRYIDRFEKRDGRWAIAARMCTSEWNNDPRELETLLELNAPLAKDPSDPSYARPFKVTREDRALDFW